MKLVIVESPTKARTIKKYLGKDFDVVASIGHIRDLTTSGEGNLGIDIKNDFMPIYEIPSSKKRTVEKLKKAVEKADEVYLATDPDREGEAISWHLAQVLDLPVETTPRLEFHEITYHAVNNALKEPRLIDLKLVQSQETRRILDRIIGFKLSNLLKQKIDSISAGRVQSVALKLIVDREKEIETFIKEEYWNFYVSFKDNKDKRKKVKAKLIKIDDNDFRITNKDDAQKIEERIPSILKVKEASEDEAKHHSRPAFTTSTLQIEAAKLYNFTSKKTMKIAQELYEGIKIGDKTTGLITYMRTDSIRLSPVFINSCKEYINSSFGENYVGTAKVNSSKNNVQNAHEAIRPTDVTLNPEEIKEYLSDDQYKLYRLIYYRTLASMMTPRISMDQKFIFNGNGLDFEVKASRTIFDGYSKVYSEFQKLEKDKEYGFEVNDEVEVIEKESEQEWTKPPYRYNEARLIKELEDLNIGRPSTYATILDTIKDRKRDYVKFQGNNLVPTDQGRLTVEQLDRYFSSIINVDYTAKMENQLDKIALGEFTKSETLNEFYHQFIDLYSYAFEHMEKIEPKRVGEKCPNCGNELIYKKGRYGEFIGCSSYPNCTYIRKIEKPIPENAKVCPKCKTGHLIIKRGKYSSFLGCSNYPNCDYSEKLYFRKKK